MRHNSAPDQQVATLTPLVEAFEILGSYEFRLAYRLRR